MRYDSISKPVSDPSRKAPAPPSIDFRFKEKKKDGVHTISASANGKKKMVVIISKGCSRTYHLEKVNKKWMGIHGYKARKDGTLDPIMREFS